jgi:hypothetical protein
LARDLLRQQLRIGADLDHRVFLAQLANTDNLAHDKRSCPSCSGFVVCRPER